MFKNLTPAQAIEILRQIRPLLAELIPLLGNGFPILEQEGENPCSEDESSRACLLQQIVANGIVISDLDDGLDGLTNEQLINILNAFQIVAEKLWGLLQDCGCTGNISTPQELFKQVFGHFPLEILYSETAESASVDTDTLPNQHGRDRQLMTLAPSTFENPERIIERIIIHELAHAFHNNLGRVQDDPSQYEFDNPSVTVDSYGRSVVVTIPSITLDGIVYTDMRVTVPDDTPMVIMDFLIETGGYYSGTDFDDGSSRRETGRYTRVDADSDSTIVLLTNWVYQQYIGSTSCGDQDCSHAEHLVSLQGHCLLDDEGSCLPLNASHPDKRYIRLPRTYLRGEYSDVIINNSQLYNYFVNERGKESTPHPQEGFADTFTLYIIEGEQDEGQDAIASDSRGQFFDHNFCDWLCSLI